MKRELPRSVIAFVAFVAPSGAWAQTAWTVDGTPSLDHADVAGRRTEPGLEAAPHRVGPLFVSPAFAALAGYEGNVFNEPDARGDVQLVAAPRLDIKLDDPRHDMTLSISGKFRRFASNETENSDEYAIRSANAIDLARDIGLSLTFDAAHRIEPRSSSGTFVDALEPVSYDRLGADAALKAELGRFRLTAGAGYQQTSFNTLDLRSGESVDQSFRDMQAVDGNVRLAYDFSGLLSAFTAVSVGRRTSRHALPGEERDSDDLTASVGLKGDLTPLVSVEMSLGYQMRDYRNALYRDFSGVGFSVEAEWYPTPLVTAQLNVTRRFRNSGNRDVAGILEDSVAANLFYDPTRRLRLSFASAVVWDRYRDTTTVARRYRLGLRAQYTLNAHVALGAQVYWGRQQVSGQPLVNAYTSPGAGIGITFTP